MEWGPPPTGALNAGLALAGASGALNAIAIGGSGALASGADRAPLEGSWACASCLTPASGVSGVGSAFLVSAGAAAGLTVVWAIRFGRTSMIGTRPGLGSDFV